MASPISVTVSLSSANIGPGVFGASSFSVGGAITPVVEGPNIGSGANTLTVPSGAIGFIFSPPSGNTFTLTLKGVSGDTGISMPKNAPFVYFFDPAAVPANFVITAGGAVGVSEVVFF